MGVNQALHIGRDTLGVLGLEAFSGSTIVIPAGIAGNQIIRDVFLYSGSHPWQWFPAVPAGMTVEGDSSDLSG